MLVWTSCTAELVTGWLLWPYRRLGGLLALGLLPLEFAFWIGFALPLVQGLATSDTARRRTSFRWRGSTRGHHQPVDVTPASFL